MKVPVVKLPMETMRKQRRRRKRIESAKAVSMAILAAAITGALVQIAYELADRIHHKLTGR